mmetsp:Transcript_96891/g.175050  ORF Transcript_96891/g.175050 Transcript_96891/m.175050 type:complete len:338 (+) Transcript_96891:70-1083(+)
MGFQGSQMTVLNLFLLELLELLLLLLQLLQLLPLSLPPLPRALLLDLNGVLVSLLVCGNRHGNGSLNLFSRSPEISVDEIGTPLLDAYARLGLHQTLDGKNDFRHGHVADGVLLDLAGRELHALNFMLPVSNNAVHIFEPPLESCPLLLHKQSLVVGSGRGQLNPNPTSAKSPEESRALLARDDDPNDPLVYLGLGVHNPFSQQRSISTTGQALLEGLRYLRSEGDPLCIGSAERDPTRVRVHSVCQTRDVLSVQLRRGLLLHPILRLSWWSLRRCHQFPVRLLFLFLFLQWANLARWAWLLQLLLLALIPDLHGQCRSRGSHGIRDPARVDLCGLV